MTKFFLKFSGIALLLVIMIATGCQEDDPIVDPIGPDITLVSESGFVSSDVELLEGEAFSVKLSLEKGDNPLQTLSMTVDGVEPKGTELSGYVTSLTIDGTAQTAQNPQLITGTAKDGSTWEYELEPAGLTVDESATFAFRVTDESGLSASVSFKVTIVAPPGTPTSRTLEGILFNQAGPSGRGALDLDEGYGTGVTTPGTNANPADAEIRDLGLDCDVPAPGFNWRRQIGTMNGADMRQVDLTKVEGFTFDAVTTIEEIVGAYETGITFADGAAVSCSSGASTPVTDVTDELVIGDMFVVVRGEKYYLIRIDDIMETGTDNNDQYEISIKY
ncbi:MAG: hypothetical protein J5I98_10375 [Phaeodactylibacter sp.]|nr:hypothetical protein [Phaeodactylibacter sp.]